MICQYFLRGNCNKGANCRNIHPGYGQPGAAAPGFGGGFAPQPFPPQPPAGQQVKECENFKRGNCRFGQSCKFSHNIVGAGVYSGFGDTPQPFGQGFPSQGIVAQGNFPATAAFGTGAPEPGECKNFKLGKCRYGAACKFRHTSSGFPGQQQQPGFFPQPGPFPQTPGFNQPLGLPQPGTFPGQPQQQGIEGFAQPGFPSSTREPPECKNFQQGKCKFGAACRYKHTQPGPAMGFPPPSNFPQPQAFPEQPRPFHTQPNQPIGFSQPQSFPQPFGFPGQSPPATHQTPFGQQQPGNSAMHTGPQQGFPPVNHFNGGGMQPLIQPFSTVTPFGQGITQQLPQQPGLAFSTNFPPSAPDSRNPQIGQNPMNFAQNSAQPQQGHQQRRAICRDWKATGTCRFGDKCRYLHTLPQSGPQDGFQPRQPGFASIGMELGFDNHAIEAEPNIMEGVEGNHASDSFGFESNLSKPQITSLNPSATRASSSALVRGTAVKEDLKGAELEAKMGPAVFIPSKMSEEEERNAFKADAFDLGKVPENVVVLYKD